jgi:uncharacterized protein YndB with AHSA1/START domain
MNDKMIIKADGAELYLERTFAAPHPRVWAAFTECQHLKHWWGPQGWDLTHCDMDFRVGGRWHYCMTGKNPENNEPIESWGLSEFTAIDAPKTYAYLDAFSNAEGSKQPGMPECEITMEFVEVDGGTKVLSRGVYASAEELQKVMAMGVEQGITETWDRLKQYLAK